MGSQKPRAPGFLFLNSFLGELKMPPTPSRKGQSKPSKFPVQIKSQHGLTKKLGLIKSLTFS